MRQSLLAFGSFTVVLLACGRKPLTPVAPWTDTADDSLYFLATTTDPGGLQVEYTFDWGDGQTFTTRRYPSGETAYVRHSFADPAWCEVRVQARNENGKSSAWSAPLRFRKSKPPVFGDDTIPGLVRWAVNRWYHTSIKVSDPDGDSVSVRFEWDGDKDGVWTPFVPSGSVITDSFLWTTIGPHAVSAIARDRGNMVARPDSVKAVNVSGMAITWRSSENVMYGATPTLGLIDGEPVLYCGLTYALDCYTMGGRLLWSVPISGSDCAPSLSPDGSRLYFTDSDSGLVCLDARTGQFKWTLPLDPSEGAECTPAIGPNGAIYITVFGFDSYCLRRVNDRDESAAVGWNARISDDYAASANSMAIGRNGVVYAVGFRIPSNTSMLVAVDSFGTLLWEDSTHLCWAGPPIIDSHDRIVVSDENEGLHCFNTDGSLAYSVPAIQFASGTSAIGKNGEVIVADFDGRVTGYDSIGHVLWLSSISTSASSTPCVAEESTVIVFDPDLDCVYGIGSDGQTLWEYSIDDSLGFDGCRARQVSEGEGKPSPVIGPNDDLYLVGVYGLFCLSGTNLHMASTAWPTYNHDAARSGWAGRPLR